MTSLKFQDWSAPLYFSSGYRQATATLFVPGSTLAECSGLPLRNEHIDRKSRLLNHASGAPRLIHFVCSQSFLPSYLPVHLLVDILLKYT
jgi:hypothetical protein